MSNKPKKKFSPKFKRVLFFIFAALVLLILVLVLFWQPLNMDSLYRKITYSGKNGESFGTYPYVAHSGNAFARWKNGLAVASTSQLSLQNDNGRTSAEYDISMVEPSVSTGNCVTAAYDVGGKKLLAMKNDGKTMLDYTTDGGIFYADISSDDHICVASSEDGYKTCIHCYDGSGKEYYEWKSSSGYLPKCAIAPGGRYMAAIAMGQEDGAYCSTLRMFHTDSEEAGEAASLGGDLVYGLHFVNKNTLCTVSEKDISFWGTDCEKKGGYHYGSCYLSDYDWNGDGFMLAALNMYKAGSYYTVVTLDYAGRELGSQYLNEDVQDVSACGNYVAVLTLEKLYIYRKDMSLYAEADNTWMANSVLQRGDGTAILLSGSGGTLYIPS